MVITEESRKVFIVGATGLIGSSAYATMLKIGYQPVVLSRNIAKAKEIFGDKVDVQFWNGIDPNALMLLINGSRAIINLAGESIASRWTAAKRDAILKAEFLLLTRLLQQFSNVRFLLKSLFNPQPLVFTLLIVFQQQMRKDCKVLDFFLMLLCNGSRPL